MAKPIPTRRATNADLPQIVDLFLAVASVGALIRAETEAVDLILVEGFRRQLDQAGILEAVIVVRPGPTYDVYCRPGIARHRTTALRREVKRRAGLALASHCVVRFWPDSGGLSGRYVQSGTGRSL